MTIDNEVKTAVETIAKARVAEALGGDVLGKIIDEVMNYRNRSYGSDNSTFFDRVVKDCIEAEIHKAVIAAIRESGDFREKVTKAIKEKAEPFAISIIDAFASDDWRATVTINVARDEE